MADLPLETPTGVGEEPGALEETLAAIGETPGQAQTQTQNQVQTPTQNQSPAQTQSVAPGPDRTNKSGGGQGSPKH